MGDIHWLTPSDLDRPCSTSGTHGLVVDLAGHAELDRIAPTQQDLADLARPIAGMRTWFLRRRALLRRLVAWRLGCAAHEVIVAHDGDGAPRVLAPSCALHVSVAARDRFAALVVADRPVGIDLEIADGGSDPLPDVLHHDERTALAGLSPEQARTQFLQLWTAKEAYLKAIGLGLKIEPAEVAVAVENDRFEIATQGARRGAVGEFRDVEIRSAPLVCACAAL